MHKPKLVTVLLLLLILTVASGCGSQPTEQALPTAAVIPVEEVVNTTETETNIVAESVEVVQEEEQVVSSTNTVPITRDDEANLSSANIDNNTETQTVSRRSAVPAAQSAPPAQPNQPDTVEPPPQEPVANQLVLRFDADTTPAERAEFIASVGGTVKEEIGALNTIVVEISEENQAQIESAGETLLAEAELDYYVTAQANITPTDTYYASQWNLQAVHMPYRWEQLPDDAPTLTVAVVDSGVCMNHPDLSGRLLPGWDFVDDDADPEDLHGHGCGMAGVIAANIDSSGITGIDPNVQILPLRVLDESSRGTYSDVAAAVIQATDEGADVINLSLAGYYPSSVMEDAVNYAAANGVLVVAAAGNSGVEQSYYPAAYENAISVGSVDSDLSISSFSNYGDTINLYAPGRDIWTLGMSDTYRTLSGTSPAAAHVSALATLAIASEQSLAITHDMMLFDDPPEEPTPPSDEVEAQAVVGVIDFDDRITEPSTAMPYGGIVQILYDGNGACTGTLLTPTRVLTLAECVIDVNGNDLFANRVVTVVPGRSGSTEPYGKIFVDTANTDIAPGWNPPSQTAIDDNYAVLTLETPLPGDISNPWELEVAPNSDLLNNVTYEISGYPNPGLCKNSADSNTCGRIQNRTSGTLFSPAAIQANTLPGQLRYRLDAENQGQRGSPIFRFDAGTSEYRIVGMHVDFGGTEGGFQYNEGVQITATVRDQIRTTWGIDDQTEVNPNVTVVGDNTEQGLRDAIEDANAAAPNPATVILQPGATYNLSLSTETNILPNITNDVTIIGRGATLRQNTTASRRMVVVGTGGKLTLVGDLTIQEFSNTQNGGAIAVQGGGELNIIDTLFQDNEVRLSGSGGAIFTFPGSVVNIENSRFVSNSAGANGGAIYNQGTMVIRNNDDFTAPLSQLSFVSNQALASVEENADQGGGAIYNTDSGTLNIFGTTFAENIAGSSSTFGNGGAIINAGDAQLNVQLNTAFIRNVASQGGGAVAQFSTQTATFNNPIFDLNIAGPRSPLDVSPAGVGSVILSEGPVTMIDVEATDNIALRRDEDAVNGIPTDYFGGAFDISDDFTLDSSSDGNVQNLIQGNKVLFDANLDLNLAGSLEEQLGDADRISQGAAFYIHGDGFNVNINDACITANISLTYQGIFRQGTANVVADGNYWGNDAGPSDGTNNAGDGVNVPVNDFLTNTNDELGCEVSTLPPTNDDLSNAFELTLLEDTLAFNNEQADVGNFIVEEGDEPIENGDPDTSCGNVAKTIWYTYTPTKSYSISLTVNPYSVELAVPRVAVFTGPRETIQDQEVACATGGTDSQAFIPNINLTANTTYYIMVGTSLANGGESSISIDVEDVIIREPLPGESFETRRPDVVWDAVGYADRYVMNIKTSNGTVDVVSDTILPGACGVTECSAQPSVSLADGIYTVQITAFDDTVANETAEQRSNTIGFIIDSSSVSVPQPVNLINPANTANLDTGQPVIVWSTRDYATRYQLNVTGPSNISVDLVPAECADTTCGFVPSQSLPDGNYTWSVTSFDETLNPQDEFYQLTSVQRTFTVGSGGGGDPQPPVLFSPDNGQTITDTRYVPMVWSAQSYATKYTLSVTLENVGTFNFDIPPYWCTSSICSVKPGRFPDGNYTWSVTAEDETLDISDPFRTLPSETRNLTVSTPIAYNLLGNNGNFNNGLANYDLISPQNQASSVSGGVLSTRRLADSDLITALATVSPSGFSQGERVEVFARIGNTSSEPKNILLGMANRNAPTTQPQLCSFVVPPNTPLSDYVAELTLPADWTNTWVGIVLQDYGEANLRVDDLGIARNAFLPANTTNCEAPPLREDNQLIVNGSFTQGTNDFVIPTSVSGTVVNGVLNTTRVNANLIEPIQQTVRAFPTMDNSPFEVTVDLANTSGTQKDVLVGLTDPNGTDPNDIIACYFTLPPNTGMKTYTMQGRTNNPWSAIQVEIYPRDNNQPNLQVDNINVTYKPYQTGTLTDCEGVNLVPNGNFDQGATGWFGFGQLSAVITGENPVASVYRTGTTADAGGRTTLLGSINANDKVEVALQLGNTSASPRRVRVQLRNQAIPSQERTCTFNIPANTSLRNYRIRDTIAENWATPELVLYFDDYNQPSLEVDNIVISKLALTYPIDSENFCFSPDVPTNTNLALNPGFDIGDGLAYYNVNAGNVTDTQSGALRFRNSTAGLLPITQVIPSQFDAGSPIELRARLGNESTSQRNIIIAIANGETLTEPQFCVFPVPASAPLTEYTLRVNTPSDWPSLAIGITLLNGDTNPAFAIADDVNVQYQPANDYNVLQCVDPNATMSLSIDSAVGVPENTLPMVANMADENAWTVEGAWTLTPDAAANADEMGWQIMATDAGGILTWQQVVDLTNSISPQLTFQSRQMSTSPVAEVQVQIGEAEWQTIQAVSASGEWETITTDLSSYVGETINVRFVWAGTAADIWQINTIQVAEAPVLVDEPTEVTLTEEPTEVIVTEEPTEVTLTEEPTEVTVTEEPTEVTLTEEPTEVTVTEEPTEVTLTEEPTEVTVTEEPTEVTVTEEPTEVTVTEEPTPQPTEEPTEGESEIVIESAG